MKVTELNEYIKRILSFDPILNNLFIEGELSNFKLHSSGHAYFSLKDKHSKINCVMFRKQFMKLDFLPEDGQKVQINGSVSVYERDGKYQLYVENISVIGEGELFKKFASLKRELKASGYFEKAKTILKYPSKIGIITSPTGAAIRDILTVLKRRNKFVEVMIYPVNVQGDAAKFDISTAIDYFNEQTDVDTIILARGGGSLEELWAFNELMVAESIFDSKIPIISGVGHETDFTISDFVSDKRAATPSEAAEMAIRPYDEIKMELMTILKRMENYIGNIIELQRVTLDQYATGRMYKEVKSKLDKTSDLLNSNKEILLSSMGKVIESKDNKLKQQGIKLDSRSPLKTLERGYAIVEKDGISVTSVDDVSKSDLIEIILKNGIINTEVVSKERKTHNG